MPIQIKVLFMKYINPELNRIELNDDNEHHEKKFVYPTIKYIKNLINSNLNSLHRDVEKNLKTDSKTRFPEVTKLFIHIHKKQFDKAYKMLMNKEYWPLSPAYICNTVFFKEMKKNDKYKSFFKQYEPNL